MTQSPCLPELPKPYTTAKELVGIGERDFFIADQMNAHYLKGYEAGSAAAAQAVPEGYALFCCPKHTGQQFTVAVAYAPPLLQICPHCDPDYLTKLAAPTQGAEGAAPQAVVEEASEDIVDQLCRAQSNVTRLLSEYQGKAMSDDVYDVFATLRDDRIPALRRAIRAALTPSPTPTAPQEAKGS